MSDDLIKRSDAIKATWQEPTYTDPLNVLTEVRDRIEAIPSADKPQGEWIFVEEFMGINRYKCSVCEREELCTRLSNYCPNCGAKMKGEDDD